MFKFARDQLKSVAEDSIGFGCMYSEGRSSDGLFGRRKEFEDLLTVDARGMRSKRWQ